MRVTRKGVRFCADYQIDFPLFRAGEGWDGDVGPLAADVVPISDSLRVRLLAFQKRTDDYFLIMENIPGGGWSHHTWDEFEKSREELQLAPFPSAEEQRREAQGIVDDLRHELEGSGYYLVE